MKKSLRIAMLVSLASSTLLNVVPVIAQEDVNTPETEEVGTVTEEVGVIEENTLSASDILKKSAENFTSDSEEIYNIKPLKSGVNYILGQSKKNTFVRILLNGQIIRKNDPLWETDKFGFFSVSGITGEERGVEVGDLIEVEIYDGTSGELIKKLSTVVEDNPERPSAPELFPYSIEEGVVKGKSTPFARVYIATVYLEDDIYFRNIQADNSGNFEMRIPNNTRKVIAYVSKNGIYSPWVLLEPTMSEHSTSSLISDLTPEASSEVTSDPKTETSSEITSDPKTETSSEVTSNPAPETSSEATSDPKPEASSEVTSAPKPEASSEITSDLKPETSNEVTSDPKTEISKDMSTSTPTSAKPDESMTPIPPKKPLTSSTEGANSQVPDASTSLTSKGKSELSVETSSSTEAKSVTKTENTSTKDTKTLPKTNEHTLPLVAMASVSLLASVGLIAKRKKQ